jgi:tRNA G18 (ribose-2'-O)-methylase SpoU/glycosyltransferase involved in cell wall biosynthesis
MVKIRFVVMGFASHRAWAEGYQRSASASASATTSSSSSSSQNQQQHDIRLTVIPGDRWKFRMMAAAAELESQIALDDEIVVVDAMIDLTVLVALLKSHRPPHQCPLLFQYFHENQMTTPFTSQDRDYHQNQNQNQTHWHYGMAHWRSLLVADGCIFNSQTHLEDFSKALPKVLKEQCPRDAIEWQLQKCHELLSTKCTVLRSGLELEELLQLRTTRTTRTTKTEDTVKAKSDETPTQTKIVPVILWNARLEEDKNPGDFLALLRSIPPTIPFQLIILGTDPSKGQQWLTQIREAFDGRILHMGWCEDRTEYAQWLQQASIVISTANHETFGISIIESIYTGALPLLPNRLSYPEILAPLDDRWKELLLYSSVQEGATKLLALLQVVMDSTMDSNSVHQELQAAIKRTVSQFRWETMGPVYNDFFTNLAKGEAITAAGNRAAKLTQELSINVLPESHLPTTDDASDLPIGVATTTEITDQADFRVQLFRPKSLRNHKEYNRQWSQLRSDGIEPALHGGRRNTVRMLEAIQKGAKIRPISFLTTPELAESVLLPLTQKNMKRATSDESPNEEDGATPTGFAPIYVGEKDLLNSIRGQKLNVGDAILAMVQFPIASRLEELLAHPPILILENVRNAENVGSILRTAFCLGITSVVASATAWAALKDSRAARCSMGTMYYQRYYKAESSSKTTTASESLLAPIQEMQKAGIRVYGIEIGDTAKAIGPHGSDRNWAAVMGNEDIGLSAAVASACDQIVFIPQAHGDSLNVGHAAAIAMFELGRDGPPKEHDGLAACT